MGYRTPNIDRIANEGMRFTDYYADQSCTAGRSTFITGQSGLRTGLTKVGLPGADMGIQSRDITIAEFARLVADVVGFDGDLEFDASRPDGMPRKLLDVGRLSALGWQAPTGLREGLARTYAWYRANAV